MGIIHPITEHAVQIPISLVIMIDDLIYTDISLFIYSVQRVALGSRRSGMSEHIAVTPTDRDPPADNMPSTVA
jgi:hypothetical protein